MHSKVSLASAGGRMNLYPYLKQQSGAAYPIVAGILLSTIVCMVRLSSCIGLAFGTGELKTWLERIPRDTSSHWLERIPSLGE